MVYYSYHVKKGVTGMGDKTVRMKYVFKEDYNPAYITGAYGGISPAGELVANFYMERMPIPNSVTYALSESGNLGEVVSVDPEDFVMVRYVQSGVIMNKAAAVFIRDWLNDQIRKMEDNNGHDDGVPDQAGVE